MSADVPDRSPHPDPGNADPLGPIRRRARALADPTRLDLLRLVTAGTATGGGWVTAPELTHRMGLHQSVVRDHLAMLADAGLVARLPASGGGRGRPPARYVATSVAGDLLADHQRVTELARLLAEVAATGRAPADVGRDHAARMPTDEHGAGRDPLERLLADLASRGFEPRVGPGTRDGGGQAGPGADGDRVEVVLDRCPLAEVARDAPAVVCALHRGLAGGLATRLGGIEVVGLTARPPDAAGCVLRVVREA